MRHLSASVVVYAVAAACFAALAWGMVQGRIQAFDQAVVGVFRTGVDQAGVIGPPWVQELGRDVTAVGSLAILGFIAVTMMGYFLIAGRRSDALRHSMTLILSVVGAFGLKHIFNRPRPDLPALARVFTPSFPSGHATISAALFVSIAILVAKGTANRAIKAYAITVSAFAVVAVGISRIYLGVHYPSDVMSGWCVGVIAVLISNEVADRRAADAH